jgi:pyridoxamine 5'-phosphate oxidase family protein
MIFTDAEYTYLAGHPLGRLATIGPDGAPQIHPMAFWLSDGTGIIDIGGPALTRSQKFRNIQADPRVSLVVDDQAGTPNPIGQTGRGIEVRGHAEIVTLDPPLIAAFSNETLPATGGSATRQTSRSRAGGRTSTARLTSTARSSTCCYPNGATWPPPGGSSPGP